jgi:nucleotide-binding universal stress UspA family protein
VLAWIFSAQALALVPQSAAKGVPMYKAIVVGTDGSDRADVAVNEAFALAKMTGAKVHAVHAVHAAAATGFSDVPGTAQSTSASLREHVDHVGTELLAKAEHQGVSAEMHNPEGDPADALISVANAVDADIIVVGNRGMAGMKRLVLGSVPNKVSHQCPCSLLIVNTDRT